MSSTLPPAADRWIIGVDAGGSKTVARLASTESAGKTHSWHTMGVGRAGPANLRRAGCRAVVRAVDEAIEGAFAEAGFPRRPVRAACLGIAGAGHAAIRQQLVQALQPLRIARHIDVTHDAEPLLEWASPPGVGVALIAGTGSLAFARAADGRTARAGGWGYLLGDAGSGFDLVRQALRTILDAVDEGVPRPPWSASLLEHFGAATVDHLIDVLYSGPPDVGQIARAAPIVLHAARDGEPAAAAVAERAAARLARQAACAAERAGLAPRSYELVLAGGLLIHHSFYRRAVERALDALAAAPRTVQPVGDPEEGALRRAARTVEASPDP